MSNITRSLLTITLFTTVLLQACQQNPGGIFPTDHYTQYKKQMQMKKSMAKKNAGRGYEGRGSGSSQAVHAPRSQHFASRSTPKSHKERDLEWVNEQNPYGYTIEIDSDEKAAAVAGNLYKAPKTARSGQFKRKKNGKEVYTGVYGSYSNQAAAEQAMKDLPENLRSKAQVQQWDNLQTDANKAAASSIFSDELPGGDFPPKSSSNNSGSNNNTTFPEIVIDAEP